MDNAQTLIEAVRLAMAKVELLQARYELLKLRARLLDLKAQILAEELEQFALSNTVN
jgi:hypothetical protein